MPIEQQEEVRDSKGIGHTERGADVGVEYGRYTFRCTGLEVLQSSIDMDVQVRLGRGRRFQAYFEIGGIGIWIWHDDGVYEFYEIMIVGL